MRPAATLLLLELGYQLDLQSRFLPRFTAKPPPQPVNRYANKV